MAEKDYSDESARQAMDATKKALNKTGGTAAKKAGNVAKKGAKNVAKKAGNKIQNKMPDSMKKATNKFSKKFGKGFNKAKNFGNRLSIKHQREKLKKKAKKRIRKIRRKLLKKLARAIAKIIRWIIHLLLMIAPYLLAIFAIGFLIAIIAEWIFNDEYSQKYASYNFQEDNIASDNPFNIDRDGNYVTQARAMSKGNKMYFVYYAFNAQHSYYAAAVDKNGKSIPWSKYNITPTMGDFNGANLIRSDDRLYKNFVLARTDDDTKKALENFTMSTNMLYLLDQSLNKPSLGADNKGFYFPEQLTKPMYTGANFNYKPLIAKDGSWNAKSFTMDTKFSPDFKYITVTDRNGNELHNPTSKEINSPKAEKEAEAKAIKDGSAVQSKWNGPVEQYTIYNGAKDYNHPYPYKQNLATKGYANGADSTTGNNMSQYTDKQQEQIKKDLSNPYKNLLKDAQQKAEKIKQSKEYQGKADNDYNDQMKNRRPVIPNPNDFHHDTKIGPVTIGTDDNVGKFFWPEIGKNISSTQKKNALTTSGKYIYTNMDTNHIFGMSIGTKKDSIWQKDDGGTYYTRSPRLTVSNSKEVNMYFKKGIKNKILTPDNYESIINKYYDSTADKEWGAKSIKNELIDDVGTYFDKYEEGVKEYDKFIKINYKNVTDEQKKAKKEYEKAKAEVDRLQKLYDQYEKASDSEKEQMLKKFAKDHPEEEVHNVQQGAPSTQTGQFLDPVDGVWSYGFGSIVKFVQLPVKYAERVANPYDSNSSSDDSGNATDGLVNVGKKATAEQRKENSEDKINLAIIADESISGKDAQEIAKEYLKQNAGYDVSNKVNYNSVTYAKDLPNATKNGNFTKVNQAVVSVGLKDAVEGTSIDSFKSNLEKGIESLKKQNKNMNITMYTIDKKTDKDGKYNKAITEVAQKEGISVSDNSVVQNVAQNISDNIQMNKNNNGNTSVKDKQKTQAPSPSTITQAKSKKDDDYVIHNWHENEGKTKGNMALALMSHGFRDGGDGYFYKQTGGTSNGWNSDGSHNEFFLSGATTPIGSVDLTTLIVKMQSHYRSTPWAKGETYIGEDGKKHAALAWHTDEGSALKKIVIGKATLQPDLTPQAFPDKDGIKYNKVMERDRKKGTDYKEVSADPMKPELISNAPEIDSDTWKTLAKQVRDQVHNKHAGPNNIRTKYFSLHGTEYFEQYMKNYSIYVPDKVQHNDKFNLTDQVNFIENGSTFETDDKKKARYENLSKLFDQTVSESSTGSQDSSDGQVQTVGGGSAMAEKIKAADQKLLKTIWNSFKDYGLSGAAIAGIMGNMTQESGFITSVNNSTGDGGHGLIQWTGIRRTQLEQFAASKHMNPDDPKTQIAMVKHDMSNPAMWVSAKYRDNSLVKFGTMSDPQEAASRFYISQMEAGGNVPSDPDGSEPNRREAAKIIYSMFNGSSVKGDKSKLEKESNGGDSADGGSGSGSDDGTGIGQGAASLMDYARGFLGNLSAGYAGDYDDPSDKNDNSGSDNSSDGNPDSDNQLTIAGSIYRSMFQDDNWSNQRDVWTYDKYNNDPYANYGAWEQYLKVGKSSNQTGSESMYQSDVEKAQNSDVAMENNGAKMFQWGKYTNNLDHEEFMDTMRAYLAILWSQNGRSTTWDDTPDDEAQISYDLDNYILNQFMDLYSPDGEMTPQDRIKKVIEKSFGDVDGDVTEKGVPTIATGKESDTDSKDGNKKDSDNSNSDSDADLNKTTDNSDADTLSDKGSDDDKDDVDAESDGAEQYAAFNAAINDKDAKEVAGAGKFNGNDVVLETEPGEKLKAFGDGTIIDLKRDHITVISKQGGIYTMSHIDTTGTKLKENGQIKKGDSVGVVDKNSKLHLSLEAPKGKIADLDLNGELADAVKSDSDDPEDNDGNQVQNLVLDPDAPGQMIDPTVLFGNESSGDDSDWGWPFKQRAPIVGAQGFGNTGGGRTNGYHDGIDFGTVPYNNQDIMAVHGGKVVHIGHSGYTQNDLGWFVVVQNDTDHVSVIYQEFAFADGDRSAIKVHEGQTVKVGDTIARLSSSYANCTHVHIGATTKPWNQAISNSFSSAGGWFDWTKKVKGK